MRCCPLEAGQCGSCEPGQSPQLAVTGHCTHRRRCPCKEKPDGLWNLGGTLDICGHVFHGSGLSKATAQVSPSFGALQSWERACTSFLLQQLATDGVALGVKSDPEARVAVHWAASQAFTARAPRAHRTPPGRL